MMIVSPAVIHSGKLITVKHDKIRLLNFRILITTVNMHGRSDKIHCQL